MIRQTTHIISFSADIRPRSEDYIKSEFLREFEEIFQVSETGPVVNSRFGIVRCPLHVGVDDSESCRFHHLQTVPPGVSQSAEIMKRSGHVLEFLTVEEEV